MTKTHPTHIAQPKPAQVVTGKIFDDPSQGTGNDKNAVSIDREAAKIAANQIRYDVIANIMTGDLSGLAWAVADGKG